MATTVTSTGALRSAWAANRPPKPEPMMTTRGRPPAESNAGTRAGDVVMMTSSPTSGAAVPGAVERSGTQSARSGAGSRPARRPGRPVGVPASPVRIVLVPGLGLDERSLARVRERVAATVVRLPGMGLPGPVPSLETLADRLLDGAGEGPLVLVGHSQSCQVVAVAARDPRVAGVVLLGPTTDPRLRSARG